MYILFKRPAENLLCFATSYSSEITLHLQITMYWNDSRLISNEDCVGELNKNTSQNIWRPNPYIFHLSSIEVVKTLAGQSEFYTKGVNGGAVEWWIEAYVRLQCPFDFSLYPFDVQECHLQKIRLVFSCNLWVTLFQKAILILWVGKRSIAMLDIPVPIWSPKSSNVGGPG
jgi:hypothetical protein